MRRFRITQILSPHSAIFLFLLAILTFLLTMKLPAVLALAPFSLDTTVIHGTNGSMTPQGTADPHLRMSPKRPATPADIAYADQIADEIRQAIAKYADVSDAQEAGYIQFPPDAEDLHLIHYVNPWLSFLETWRIDPQQPGSLLYERQPDRSLRLLGVMFTAPAEASLEELNERIPLSITRWHLHTNMCVPDPIWDEKQWERMENGQPLFGPDSPIATQRECEAINGDFHPTIFGWMVHANVFAPKPADVWNPHYGH